MISLDLTPIAVTQALIWPPLLEEIRALAPRFGSPVYLVGGAVRDAYMKRPIHDLDFVTAADGRGVARLIANKLHGAYYPLDAERDVGRAIIDYGGERYEIDVARFRGQTLADDLSARDFTVNAMAIPLDGDPNAIIDPLGGMKDIKAKRLRRCSPDAISSDPIRALRAVRQSNALKLMIEPETREDIRHSATGLMQASVERVRDEFMKTLDGPQPQAAIRALDSLGLLQQIVPEVVAMRGVTQSAPHIFDVWEHTLKVIEALSRVLAVISPERTDETAADGSYGMIVYRLDRYRPRLQEHLTHDWPVGRTHRALLMLSALLHDCGKPATRTVDEHGTIHFYRHEIVGADMAEARATALRLSNDEVNRVTTIVRNHMRPMHLDRAGTVSRRALYRFWNAAGVAGLDVCVLTQADYLGIYGVTIQLPDWLAFLEIVATLLEGYFNQYSEVVAPSALLSGSDLIQALDLTPGPVVGKLLRLINEAHAVGEISTVEEALALARQQRDAPEVADDE